VVIGETDALLVECKWSSKPVGNDILVNLERKASLLLPELGDRRIYFAFCSRSGYTRQLIEVAQERKDVLLFDLPSIVR
jgi:uncharacterized protein